MKVLDIGCGWGGFARYAAEKYGVSVVGITVSREQAKLARERCKGLPVEIRLQDYRALDEKFDRIVSVGMIEHVGRKNYRTYFRVADRCLNQGGLFLLHTIGRNRSGSSSDPWIERYIFPNSMLPSLKQLTGAVEGLFVVEDVHNFGPDYDKTLLAWYKNFTKHWKEIEKKGKYGKRLDVDVLFAQLRGLFPLAQESALADRAVERRCYLRAGAVRGGCSCGSFAPRAPFTLS